MKAITENYQPITPAFRQQIQDYLRRRKYIRIHYFNSFHEYLYSTAIIKEILDTAAGSFISLSSGEEVRLDRIVRLDGKPAPGYDIEDFTCDC
ncbi:MAG: hypothetical protein ACO1O1_14195 [Adhaeribacter sp.]